MLAVFAAALLAALAACEGQPNGPPAAAESAPPVQASRETPVAVPAPPREPPALPDDPRGAAGVSARQEPARAPGLALELSSPKPRYRLGEPVELFVRLVNGGPEKREVRDLLDPAYGFLKVVVIRPDGKEPVAWQPPVRKDGRKQSRERVVLEPDGPPLSASLPLFLSGGQQWFLDRPGPYRVTAEWGLGDEVRPAEATFTVLAPADEDDAAAAEILMRPAVARFLLLDGGAEAGPAVADLRTLVERHGASPLAAHAHLALGAFLGREVYDPAQGALRPPDLEAAATHLERALGRLDDPLRKSEARHELARCLHGLGRTKDARRVLVEAAPVEEAYRRLPLLRDLRAGIVTTDDQD